MPRCQVIGHDSYKSSRSLPTHIECNDELPTKPVVWSVQHGGDERIRSISKLGQIDVKSVGLVVRSYLMSTFNVQQVSGTK